MGKLSDVAIRAWIRSGERFEGRSDGDGLVLTWRPERSAPSWMLRYRFAGKSCVMDLGSYTDLPLGAARQSAKELRAKIALGHCRHRSPLSTQAILASYGHLPYIAVRETIMANQDTPDTTRDARLEARVSAAQKSLLQQAAALSGRTLSEFVVASAQDAARRVIAEHESICLSREEQLAFVQALLNPPEPNARLKRAAKAYRRNVSQRTGA